MTTTPSITRINPPDLGTPAGYSQVVELSAGRMLFIAGQTALAPDGNSVATAMPFKRCSSFLWSEHMDGFSLELPIFLVATFAGALVAGLSGFAFGLVAASIWLYILTPLQTATLIIAFGLIVQGYSVWKLRRALDWKKLWPFVAGAALGVPVGVSILNGVLGGITGLAGILVTIWCGLRGWPKDVQRTVFQPVAVAIFLMSALWIGARGAITADTIKLFVIGLPALFAGIWLGLKLYGRLNEAAFRKVVLVLLLVSGVALIV